MKAAFVIWSVMACIFLAIGISCRRSRSAVGFWANVSKPEVTDVKQYNREVSGLWLVGSLLFELLGLPFLFAAQNSPLFIITMLGTVFLVLGMMVRYSMIESRYRK